MRVVSLHEDVLVATSQVWQTTCTAVRAGEECFVIDSPVFADELEALPVVLSQAGFGAPSGLLVTHADWDHLLGRLAFPEAALGVSEATAEVSWKPCQISLETAVGRLTPEVPLLVACAAM